MSLGRKIIVAGTAVGLMAITACDKMNIAEPVDNPSSIADQPCGRCLFIFHKYSEFPGGYDSLVVWIKENIKWPESANDSTPMGKVVIGFSIHPDGTPKDFKIIKSVCPELDSAALETIKKMPKWEPAGPGVNEDVKYRIK